ncbi:MAG: hypothetical protein AB7N65_07745 [Vicinamibacterales bacterium]
MMAQSGGVSASRGGAVEDLMLLTAAVYLVPLSIIFVGLPIALVVWLVRALAARF